MLMKTRLLLFVMSAMILVSVRAGEPLGVNAFFENRAEFAGKEVTLTGLVDRVSAARRMVVLIDTTEADCTDACDRKTVVVQVPDAVEIPAKGSFITASGTVVPDADPPQLAGTTITAGAR